MPVFDDAAVRSPSLVPLRRDAGPTDDQLRQRILSLPHLEHGDLVLEQMARYPLDAAALALAVPVAAQVGHRELVVRLTQRLLEAAPVGRCASSPWWGRSWRPTSCCWRGR
ncbi:MAG: hypothetical protein R2724_34810 [Bryobacterales bacterium]